TPAYDTMQRIAERSHPATVYTSRRRHRGVRAQRQ
ncbi:hypothetical protein A2U01_0093593, partial [Trifolium medium]|nr:hypothetical protein [Trifolium medium]